MAPKLKNQKMDLLHGSIWDKMLLFALPLAATSMLQQLFNAADIAIVGQFVSKEAMAAVGSNAPIISLFVNSFLGISMGANVVISRYTGQGNPKGIKKGVQTAVMFSFLAGICVAIIGEIAAPGLLRLMDVPDNVFSMSLTYLRVYMIGLPVIFLYNFEAAVFMSQGDTRTPMICLTTAGLINVALNLFFVCVLGMNADGVALATVLSNVISSGLLFIILLRRKDAIHLELKGIKIHGDVLKIMIKIGVPAAVQSMVFSLSNICVQSAVNSLGSDVIAASAAAFNVEVLAYYLLNSFGQACTTFIGQNHGANNIPRCRRVTRVGLGLDMLITVTFSFILIIFAKDVLALFNSDPVIAEIGAIRIRTILFFEAGNVLMEIFSASMRGYGNSLPPALITLIGVCGSRIIWVYTVFRYSHTFRTLMIVYPVSWGIAGIALIITYLKFIKKLERKTSNA